MPPSLPEISSLPSLPSSTHIEILNTLFEPSSDLHSLSLPLLSHQTFPSYPSLIDAVGARMTALSAANTTRDKQVLDGVLGAHPRLGEKQEKELSELSKGEQEQLKQGKREEFEELRRLNAEYEARFPGLRYVVFVNGRGRDVIMQDMRRRIERGDIELERAENINAMCDIAKDRARKLQAAESAKV